MKARVARAPVLAPPVTQRPNESRFKSVCQTSPSRAKLPFSPPETPSTAAPSTLSTPLASPSRKVPGLGRAWDSALEEASTLGWPPTGFLAGLELPFPHPGPGRRLPRPAGCRLHSPLGADGAATGSAGAQGAALVAAPWFLGGVGNCL
ncbi:unnamed protein product [Polarella glacialis]|uniref:Uncharacterized protein n=1 Tax=Polarella glacialis TaxID=89957 RepID=A0A813HF85_POLGL|nr:unnamed protein product [Polarella glacialis]